MNSLKCKCKSVPGKSNHFFFSLRRDKYKIQWILTDVWQDETGWGGSKRILQVSKTGWVVPIVGVMPLQTFSPHYKITPVSLSQQTEMQISTLLPHAVELCTATCFHFTSWSEMKPWERQTLCGLGLCLLSAAGCAGCTPLRTFIYIAQKRARGRSQENREPRRTRGFYSCSWLCSLRTEENMWNMRQFLSTVEHTVTNETDGR